MNNGKRFLGFSICVLFLISFRISPCLGQTAINDMSLARMAVLESMALLGMSNGAEGVLVLTSALYGNLHGQGAEACRDVLSEVTGCTTGKRSLIDAHTPVHDALWFALCGKATHQIVFLVGGRKGLFRVKREEILTRLSGTNDTLNQVTVCLIG